MNTSIRLDHSLLSLDGAHDVHAMLELSVPAPAEADARPPLRLALVLDRSGSMTGEKLEVAKRCATWLVSRLRADDELALVAYDDSVRLLAPLAPVREAELRARIASLAPGGSTNLSGGWLRGLEQLRGGRGKILLLTDGLANVGVTDPARLVALARGAGQDGVGTATIGYGSDFDEELLAAMADAGGGNAHWAATPDAAPGIFAAELDGLTRVVAQNVSVEIRPAAAVELVGVLNEYPSVPVAGGVQLELGDGYGGERRRVVFALHVPHLAALGPAKVADVVVRYVSVGDEIAHHELTVPVVANVVSAEEAARAEPDAEVREEVLVLAAARARDEAIKLADSGDYDAARARLAATTKQLRAVGGPVLAAEATALAEALPLLESFDAADRKRLFYESNERKRRRS